jgi:hypothetical protein
MNLLPLLRIVHPYKTGGVVGQVNHVFGETKPV